MSGDTLRMTVSKMGTFLRNRYFTAVGSSSVRMVADRHRLAVIITSTADELSVGTNMMTLNDLEIQKIACY